MFRLVVGGLYPPTVTDILGAFPSDNSPSPAVLDIGYGSGIW